MPSVYDFLTSGYCYKVFDAETTVDADGHRRIVAFAIAEVVDGEELDEVTHWLINSESPIDEHSQRIHGITDEDVANEHNFETHAPEIIAELLRTPTEHHKVVWVAHHASFDIGALGWAFDQCGIEMPELPVLDTFRLPEQLEQPPNRRMALPDLAAALGVEGLEHHNPVSDAHTTALILIALLESASRSGVATPEQLLAHAKPSTSFGIENSESPPTVTHPTQPQEHTAEHPEPLPANPTALQRKQWALGFLRCANSACEHVRVLAEQLRNNTPLFSVLVTQAKTRIPPGTVGAATLLGALNDPMLLVTVGDTKGLVTKWLELRRALHPHSCPAIGELVERCPDCREGNSCPADVFHHALGQRLCGTTVRGEVSKHAIDTHAGSSEKLRSWVRRGAGDLAGYVAWLCMSEATNQGNHTGTGKIRSHVETLHLDTMEPRLTLLSAVRLVSQDRKGAAQQLVEDMLLSPNADPAFVVLQDYRTAHLLQPPEAVAREIKTKPRYGATVRRPPTRRATPRFKIG